MTPLQDPQTLRNGPFIGAGTFAGIFAVLLFTAVHQVLISAIWFALPAMLGAGAACGASLAWSYLQVVSAPSAPTWLRYITLFLAMFVLLGIVSVVTFEPQTTIAALLKTNEPPRQLIGRALPMTGLFAVATVVALTLLYRPHVGGALSLLVTTTLLLLVLGLNISILGLVEVPRAQLGVLAETFALLGTLVFVYGATVFVLQRARLPWRSA